MNGLKAMPRMAACVAAVLVPGMGTCFAAVPGGAPGAGAILQQLEPAPRAPSVPRAVVTLPGPTRQKHESKLPIPVRRVRISGNRLVPTKELVPLMSNVEGRSVTLGRLREAVGRITKLYQQRGYPLAFAYLPPQTIRHGVVRVTVVEPHYDRVEVTGHSRFRAAQARRVMGVHAGAPVTMSSLNRGLLLLNRTPGVRVHGALIPGAAPGTTTLRLRRVDRPLLGVRLSQSNYGSPYTGAAVTSGTVTVNDPFGYGSALAVNGVISGANHLHAGSFELDSPDLWNGLQAGLYGSATDYRLGGAFAALDEVGRANQIGGYLSDPVILAPGREVDLRFDVLETWLAQSTRATGTTARQRIPLERLSVSGQFADRFRGITSVSVSLAHGNLSIGPASARAADAAGPQAAGSFEVARFRLGRLQALPRGFSLSLDAQGQLAGQNLDSSQQFYLGGPYGVMSYAVGAGGGDDGYLLSAKLSHRVPVPRLPGVLTASLLAQSGTVWVNHTVYAGFVGKNVESASGVGVGLNYLWHGFGLTLDYAHQLGANSARLLSRAHNQVWVALSYTR